MHLRHALSAVLALAACATSDQQSGSGTAPAERVFAGPPLSETALLEHINILASDEFEGRAPGTNGERLTLDYLERSFAAAGLQPGVALPDGTRSWRQEVPLTAATLTNTPTLTLTGRDGAREYAYATQFSAWTRRLDPTVDVANAPLVFVGYGVNAPELGWNDYEGVDVRGKIVVMLINDPDFETGDDRGFGGRAMTYYGRWTYKFEEAGRQGAAGAIIVHETAGASYPWAVIQSSTGPRPRWDVLRADGGANRTGFEGWITNEVAMETFRRAGLDFNQLKARAQTRGFRAVPMGTLRGSLHLETRAETRMTYNVIGVLPGRARPQETIIYSAHWDHLGRCPAIDGDDICNGALDNATGTAALIELARRFSADGAGERSVAFAAWTAEEQGLLGALYYSQHPVFAPRDTVANINMDGINSMGRTRDIEIVGMGKSEMDDLAVAAAQAQGRRVEPDSNPEAGYFYRSDQLHLAQLGIPVLYTSNGIDMLEGGVARGRALNEAYVANNYHKPSDEVTPEWNMSGGVEDLQLLYAVGRGLADNNSWPQWRANAEFRAARTQSGR
ncbi:MAG TPA: M28 family metallopeptidase [Candidatus Binatia bacterium]|nr:M28 family metallopeptidase [Candidatus Binatia bacterium]